MRKILIICICVSIVEGERQKLASYIEACRRNDINLNECALKSANKALPYLIAGDAKHKVPPMNPIHLNYIEIEPGNNLKLTLTNISTYGFDKAAITHVQLDIEKRDGHVRFECASMMILGSYSIDGMIQILPITGQGPCNITYDHFKADYFFHYELVKRKSIEYMNITEHNLKFQCKRAYYILDNLFNGSELGSTMRTFLLENWEDVHKDIGPLISQAADAILYNILDNLIHRVPYNEVFPDD